MPAEWEPEAEKWIRWARTPGFDVYCEMAGEVRAVARRPPLVAVDR